LFQNWADHRSGRVTHSGLSNFAQILPRKVIGDDSDQGYGEFCRKKITQAVAHFAMWLLPFFRFVHRWLTRSHFAFVFCDSVPFCSLFFSSILSLDHRENRRPTVLKEKRDLIQTT
jgi:hypothetical protein